MLNEIYLGVQSILESQLKYLYSLLRTNPESQYYVLGFLPQRHFEHPFDDEFILNNRKAFWLYRTIFNIFFILSTSYAVNQCLPKPFMGMNMK